MILASIADFLYTQQAITSHADMSEDYNKFDEILPFTVNTDPNIKLNDEHAPWLQPARS
jgi:endo-beta-N-acetylglucosaminidase D